MEGDHGVVTPQTFNKLKGYNKTKLCLRLLSSFLNITLMIMALILTAFGWMLTSFDSFPEFIFKTLTDGLVTDQNFTHMQHPTPQRVSAISCYIIGLGVFLTALFIYGYFLNNLTKVKHLAIFEIILAAACFSQISFALIYIWHWDRLPVKVAETFFHDLEYYGTNDTYETAVWDALMGQNPRCCGYEGVDDFRQSFAYGRLEVPKFCCGANATESCPIGEAAPIPGCRNRILGMIYPKLQPFTIIFGSFLLGQLLLLIVTAAEVGNVADIYEDQQHKI